MALDTQIPPWLQHNITQKNDSPWLINALEQGQRIRQRQAEFPLHLQQMQLRNQAIELEVERQGMVNEIASEDLISEQREMPLVAEWVRNTKGNPMRILNDPIPQVTNQRLQKIVMDTQHMAAQNAYVQATQKYQIGLTEAAAKLVTLGKNVKPKMDENGQQYFDPEDLAEAAKTVRDEEREFILQKIGAQTAWHTTTRADITPNIQVIEGDKYLVNPKTGHFERIDKTASRSQFIAQHITQYMKDQMIDGTAASTALGKIYDEQIAQKPATEAAPAPTQPRFRWENGKVVPVQ